MRGIAVIVAMVVLAAGCRAPEDDVALPTPSPPTRTAPPTPSPAVTPERTPTAAPPAAAPTAYPATADDPAGLAAQLGEVERAIRDPQRDLADMAVTGHLQQTIYRRLARTPEWRDEVLAGLPDGVRDPARANLDAVTDLVAMITPLGAGSRPSWRIVAPAPADELLAHYRAAAEEFGIGWEYLAAIHLVETRLGRIRGTSVAGAQGPMQFMPGTWEAYGEGDVNDNRDAIRAAARYLRSSGGPDDMDQALFRYNRSSRYVRAIQAHAAVLRAEPAAFRGYYHWQVHYITEEGDLLLPVGYPEVPALVP